MEQDALVETLLKFQDLVLQGCVLKVNNGKTELMFNKAESLVDFLEQSYPIESEEQLVRIIHSHWDIVMNPRCNHPNAYYYGDTCPATYKCDDCGACFICAEELIEGV